MKSFSILVVEDNPVTRNIYRATLEALGYEVRDAEDACTALAEMDRQAPDFIIQDLLLPDMDGFELVGQLRRLAGGARVPIVAVTGMLTPIEEPRARAAGFSSVFIKPFDAVRLGEVARLIHDTRHIIAPTPCNVLLVGGQTVQLKLLDLALRTIGCTLRTVGNVTEALVEARSMRPTAIITEVALPEGDGFSLCESLRQDPHLADVPVVLVSSYSSDEPSAGGRGGRREPPSFKIAEGSGGPDAPPRSGDRTPAAPDELERRPGQGSVSAFVSLAGGVAPVVEKVAELVWNPRGTAPVASSTGEGEGGEQLDRDRDVDRILAGLRGQDEGTRPVPLESRQSSALALLSAFAETMEKSGDVERSLVELLSQALDAAGVPRGRLYLLDTAGRLVLRSTQGEARSVTGTAPASPADDERVLHQVLDRGEPQVFTASASLAEHRGLVERLGGHTVLAVPVSAREKPLGVLCLISDARALEDHTWTSFGRVLAIHLGQSIALARMYEHLSASERRYRTLFETASDSMFTLALDGRITDMNSQAEVLLGRPRPDVIGHSYLEFAGSPEMRSRYSEELTRVLAEGSARAVDFTVVRADGEVRGVDIAAVLTAGDQGQTVFVIVGDVTERRRDERLQRAEHAAARILATATTIEQAAPDLLGELVVSVGWDLGLMWRLDPPAGVLRLMGESGKSGGAGGALAEFVTRSREIAFQSGIGLPGRTMATYKPHWISDVVTDTNFPRAATAARVGLHGALAAPILAGDEFVGVLELFSTHVRSPDERLLAMLAAIGAQIGQYMMRRKSEMELQTSERRFRQLSESIREVFWIASPALDKIEYVSAAYANVWGRTCESLYEDPGSRLGAVHPDDRTRVTQEALAKQATGDFDLTYRIVLPGGAQRWIRDRSRPVRDDSGRVTAIVGISENITDLKQSEDALVERAALAELTAEVGVALTVGGSFAETMKRVTDRIVARIGAAFARIWTLNKREKVLEMCASSGLYTHLDGPHARVPVGKFKIGLIAEERVPHFTNDVLNDPRVGDHDWARREGMVSFAGHPLIVGDELVGVMALFARKPLGSFAIKAHGAVADMVALAIRRETVESGRASMEGQLRQAQKMEAFGQLAGGVAHDFNNILSVILGNAELAREDLRPDDPLIEHLDVILQCSKRATSLTRQLLAFSRKQLLQPRALDLNAAVADVQRMLVRLIGEDIRLSFNRGQPLSPVLADPGQVEQIILNLVVNARDAMPLGGEITIETADVFLDRPTAMPGGQELQGMFVALRVRDTGCGIPDRIRDRVFEPFFTTKEPGKGTGLGLATVMGIAQQSGGAVDLQSAEGAGSTLIVYLPRAPAGAAAALVTTPSDRRGGGSETILLVEDEADVRLLAVLMLRRRGYVVLEAASSDDALVIARGHRGPIDLVLTDVVMPGASGPQVVARIREERADIKVLFMSGYLDDAVMRHGVENGKVPLLQKPFSADSLAQAVRRALGRAPDRGAFPSS